MFIRKGDKVKILKGKDRGKIAEVLHVFSNESKVLVQGVNLVKRHVKPGKVSKEGGIVNIEKPISVANVMYFNDKLKRPVRVGFKKIDGKSYRYCKESGEVLGK